MNALTEVLIEQLRQVVASPATSGVAVEHVKALLFEYDRIVMCLEQAEIERMKDALARTEG